MTVHRWVIVTLIFLGTLVSYVDRSNLSLAVVPIATQFGYSAGAMGILLSSFFWTYVFSQIPSGIVIDRYGFRRTFALAFLVWSLASAGVGLSRGYREILMMRLILGVAESIVPIASIAYIRRNFDTKSQGLPTAIYLSASAMGPAVGTLLGAHLLSDFGWRGLFLITGLGALVWLLPWLAAVPKSTDWSVDTDEPALPHASAILAQMGTVAGVGMAACAFLFAYYFYFVFTWAPAYLQMAYGFGTLEMGHLLAIPLFGMAIANLVGGVVADRISRATGRPYAVRVWFTGIGMLGSGSIALLTVMPGRHWILPVMLVSLCSLGAATTNFWSLSQAISPASGVGRTLGYLNGMAQLAGVAAPLVTGGIIGSTHRYHLVLVIAGACPMLAGAAMLIVGSERLIALRQNLDRIFRLDREQAT